MELCQNHRRFYDPNLMRQFQNQSSLCVEITSLYLTKKLRNNVLKSATAGPGRFFADIDYTGQQFFFQYILKPSTDPGPLSAQEYDGVIRFFFDDTFSSNHMSKFTKKTILSSFFIALTTNIYFYLNKICSTNTYCRQEFSSLYLFVRF